MLDVDKSEEMRQQEWSHYGQTSVFRINESSASAFLRYSVVVVTLMDLQEKENAIVRSGSLTVILTQ